jgi:hypothetical protein
MWLNTIKNESSKARSLEHVPLLFKYDDIKDYSYQAAETFNEFFLTLIKNMHILILLLYFLGIRFLMVLWKW